MHTWWRGDPLPDLPPIPDLVTEPAEDFRRLIELTGIDEGGIRERLAHNHRPWLARLGIEPVGYGWIAADQTAIPHLGLTLAYRPGDRYLWDFATLPPWRGRGIYPRLLQAMVRHDQEADRFWIGHDHANLASMRGIARAGFRTSGMLHHRPDAGYEFTASGPIERATAAASLLGVPLAEPAARSGAL
jgi:GNAT superfamily N-acetyltransferase